MFATTLTLLRRSFDDWLEDRAPRLGAALAFYSTLSLAPLLFIALEIAALFFGPEVARAELERRMQNMIGEQGSAAVNDMLKAAVESSGDWSTAVISVFFLLLTASGVFSELQDSLNTIWEVRIKPGRTWLRMIRDRIASFAMVAAIALLLLLSLIINTLLTSLGFVSEGASDAWLWGVHAINAVISLTLVTVMFAMMFKILPDVKLAWRHVWFGAFLTAVLFTVGKFAIGRYLGSMHMESSYGVAASLVILQVWIYYSAQIFLFGAEFTQSYTNHLGERVIPSDHAEAIER